MSDEIVVIALDIRPGEPNYNEFVNLKVPEKIQRLAELISQSVEQIAKDKPNAMVFVGCPEYTTKNPPKLKGVKSINKTLIERLTIEARGISTEDKELFVRTMEALALKYAPNLKILPGTIAVDKPLKFSKDSKKTPKQQALSRLRQISKNYERYTHFHKMPQYQAHHKKVSDLITQIENTEDKDLKHSGLLNRVLVRQNTSLLFTADEIKQQSMGDTKKEKKEEKKEDKKIELEHPQNTTLKPQFAVSTERHRKTGTFNETEHQNQTHIYSIASENTYHPDFKVTLPKSKKTVRCGRLVCGDYSGIQNSSAPNASPFAENSLDMLFIISASVDLSVHRKAPKARVMVQFDTKYPPRLIYTEPLDKSSFTTPVSLYRVGLSTKFQMEGPLQPYYPFEYELQNALLTIQNEHYQLHQKLLKIETETLLGKNPNPKQTKAELIKFAEEKGIGEKIAKYINKNESEDSDYYRNVLLTMLDQLQEDSRTIDEWLKILDDDTDDEDNNTVDMKATEKNPIENVIDEMDNADKIIVRDLPKHSPLLRESIQKLKTRCESVIANPNFQLLNAKTPAPLKLPFKNLSPKMSTLASSLDAHSEESIKFINQVITQLSPKEFLILATKQPLAFEKLFEAADEKEEPVLYKQLLEVLIKGNGIAYLINNNLHLNLLINFIKNSNNATLITAFAETLLSVIEENPHQFYIEKFFDSATPDELINFFELANKYPTVSDALIESLKNENNILFDILANQSESQLDLFFMFLKESNRNKELVDALSIYLDKHKSCIQGLIDNRPDALIKLITLSKNNPNLKKRLMEQLNFSNWNYETLLQFKPDSLVDFLNLIDLTLHDLHKHSHIRSNVYRFLNNIPSSSDFSKLFVAALQKPGFLEQVVAIVQMDKKATHSFQKKLGFITQQIPVDQLEYYQTKFSETKPQNFHSEQEFKLFTPASSTPKNLNKLFAEAITKRLQSLKQNASSNDPTFTVEIVSSTNDQRKLEEKSPVTVAKETAQEPRKAPPRFSMLKFN